MHTVKFGFGLVAVFVLFLTMAPSPHIVGGATYTVKESYYIGQVTAVNDLSIMSSKAFVEAAQAYDGSAQSDRLLVSECRMWRHLNAEVNSLTAPSSFDDLQTILESSYGHLQKAGEYCETGIVTADPSYIELATREIKLATSDLDKAAGMIPTI